MIIDILIVSSNITIIIIIVIVTTTTRVANCLTANIAFAGLKIIFE